MLDAVKEVRQALYENINGISTWVLLIFQFLHFKQRRKFPSFCIEEIQRIFNRPFKNKILNTIFDFLSRDYLWLIFYNHLAILFNIKFGS